MPRAEVTWNGIAKSYRVGSQVFQQNRSRTEDWPEELYSYLKVTKGFSVVDKDPVPAKAKPVAEKVAEKKVEEKPAEPEEDTTEDAVTTSATGPSRRPRRRSSS